MAKKSDAPSRMEILVLSTIARRPMHGYDLKLELRYKHVRWWAKCEHGHVYATIERLAQRGDLELVRGKSADGRRVYKVTPAGRARLEDSLRAISKSPDSTYFDVDLFLAAAHVLDREDVITLLEQREKALEAQLDEARDLQKAMSKSVPPVALLIMDHRVEHLEHEIAFLRRAARAVAKQERWGAFLGKGRIQDFLERTGVEIE